ncbi:conjugal transfer protein TraB [Streptomyces sp. URMC 125]|uniref:conjugal transfer protein TraB n=1 Tax=Streptomyces sp. URMC 125 TaxID=3423419 RepID=UPI003F1C9ABC
MSDLVPHTGSAAPAPADDDHRYKAVQSKLGKLGAVMDDLADDLEALRRGMQANAARAERVAGDIENADLDAKFVAVTNEVAVALGGAATQVTTLRATAQDVGAQTHQAKDTHATLYGALDDIRSNRSEKTPKPGFFAR